MEPPQATAQEPTEPTRWHVPGARRSSTTADAAGLTLRRNLRKVVVRWQDVASIAQERRTGYLAGWMAVVRLNDGSMLTQLPGISTEDGTYSHETDAALSTLIDYWQRALAGPASTTAPTPSPATGPAAALVTVPAPDPATAPAAELATASAPELATEPATQPAPQVPAPDPALTTPTTPALDPIRPPSPQSAGQPSHTTSPTPPPPSPTPSPTRKRSPRTSPRSSPAPSLTPAPTIPLPPAADPHPWRRFRYLFIKPLPGYQVRRHSPHRKPPAATRATRNASRAVTAAVIAVLGVSIFGLSNTISRLDSDLATTAAYRTAASCDPNAYSQLGPGQWCRMADIEDDDAGQTSPVVMLVPSVQLSPTDYMSVLDSPLTFFADFGTEQAIPSDIESASSVTIVIEAGSSNAASVIIGSDTYQTSDSPLVQQTTDTASLIASAVWAAFLLVWTGKRLARRRGPLATGLMCGLSVGAVIAVGGAARRENALELGTSLTGDWLSVALFTLAAGAVAGYLARNRLRSAYF